MTSKTVAALLADLEVTRSHSRPRVSNDNPYSESLFKTSSQRSTKRDRSGHRIVAERACGADGAAMPCAFGRYTTAAFAHTASSTIAGHLVIHATPYAPRCPGLPTGANAQPVESCSKPCPAY